ncbi:hypothetical protein F5B17DRAFT_397827 [Nemania serpens]|nr:hypothetical protein F5B17DRAFT_397827 [Nemania serpens]
MVRFLKSLYQWFGRSPLLGTLLYTDVVATHTFLLHMCIGTSIYMYVCTDLATCTCRHLHARFAYTEPVSFLCASSSIPIRIPNM